MGKINHTLREMCRAMHHHFGHLDWWPAAPGASPGERALEICLGAILTQNTNWTNVEKALARLIDADGMSVGSLHAMPQERLAGLIRPSGYFNLKAQRIKHFVTRVMTEAGGDLEVFLSRPVERLREDLLSISGIGPETADSMILYAAGKPSFVIDTYTRRVLVRHRLVDAKDSYEDLKALFESCLPRRVALWNDYHAQFVAIGKHFCRPASHCQGCPLEGFPHDGSLKP
jgi:endonuclease III related protein